MVNCWEQQQRQQIFPQQTVFFNLAISSRSFLWDFCSSSNNVLISEIVLCESPVSFSFSFCRLLICSRYQSRSASPVWDFLFKLFPFSSVVSSSPSPGKRWFGVDLELVFWKRKLSECTKYAKCAKCAKCTKCIKCTKHTKCTECTKWGLHAVFVSD